MDTLSSVGVKLAECLVQLARSLARVSPYDVESNKFGSNLWCQRVTKRREDPYSYVLPTGIIHHRKFNERKIVILLLDADVEQHVCFVSILGMGGLGKAAFASYMCHSQVSETSSRRIKEQSEFKEDPLLWNSPPSSGNQKEQKDGIKETPPITGEEDEKSDYNSSLTFVQLSALAISSFLLCWLALFPKFDKRNEAIPAAALIISALASRISLQTVSKRPEFAHCCGFLAVLSLIVGFASFTFIQLLCLVN